MQMHSLLVVTLLLFSSAASHAAPRGSRLGHDVSVAGGIASPSTTTAGLGENPAGLPYNVATSVTAALLTEDSDFDPLVMGGLITLGNGSMGASVGLQRYNSGDNLDLNLGVGAMIEPLQTQFGVAARRALQPSGGDFDFDLGAIINPRSATRLGVMAIGVEAGIDAWGAGVAIDPSADVTFAVDATYETAGETLMVKPGLQVRASSLALSVGYGIEGQAGAASLAPGIREGFSAGMAYTASTNFKLEAYYEQLARYAIFLTFMF